MTDSLYRHVEALLTACRRLHAMEVDSVAAEAALRASLNIADTLRCEYIDVLTWGWDVTSDRNRGRDDGREPVTVPPSEVATEPVLAPNLEGSRT